VIAAKPRVAVQMGINQALNRHTGIFGAMLDYARQRDNWHLLIDEWTDHTLPGRGAAPSPFDGVVGPISDQGERRARQLDLPVVNLWYNSPVCEQPSVFALCDAGGRLRAKHLLSRGFHHFGAVYHEPFQASRDKAHAFERKVRASGCDSFSQITERERDVSIHRRGESYRVWKQSTRASERWLDTLQLPVGLFISHIDTARVIIEMCRNRGWRVPEDIAIVAGTNEGTVCERPEPALTSLEVPFEQIGFDAAKMLNHLINRKVRGFSPYDGKNAAPAKLLPPVGVVARQSTDFFAVYDQLVRRALRFIDENLHRPLTLETVAYATNVSRRTLTNRFRHKLNRTIAAEIQRLRIERVKRELAATNRPVKQIARQAGFASQRTMNEAFRREAGCTPGEFRNSRTANKK
jgi:LacI family transcriptional regulator